MDRYQVRATFQTHDLKTELDHLKRRRYVIGGVERRDHNGVWKAVPKEQLEQRQ